MVALSQLKLKGNTTITSHSSGGVPLSLTVVTGLRTKGGSALRSTVITRTAGNAVNVHAV